MNTAQHTLYVLTVSKSENGKRDYRIVFPFSIHELHLIHL